MNRFQTPWALKIHKPQVLRTTVTYKLYVYFWNSVTGLGIGAIVLGFYTPGSSHSQMTAPFMELNTNNIKAKLISPNCMVQAQNGC